MDFKVANGYCAFQLKCSGCQGNCGTLRDIEFVFQLADELFQHVLYRDQTSGRAKLIDHNREMAFSTLEFREQVCDRL